MISLKDKNVLLVNAFDDEIEQEGNGKYQLSFKYPTSDQRWKNIELADLLLADDLHGEQEFRVFEIVKRNGYIFVYANQVVDDLNSYSINNISVDRVNGQTAMQALAGSIVRKHPFAFYSDIQDRHIFNQKNISVMDALANGKHSIVGQWGGDLVRDKYNVNLLKRGGRESEALFMYKKNLKSYTETNSIKGLFTRLNLSVKDSDIKTTVDSPLIDSYGGRIYELNIEVTDQDVTTLERLQEYGRNYFAEKLIDVPNNSLTISVTDNQEYDVRIFDMVFVHHEIFDKDLRMKITSYRFSPMGRKLKSIGFGKIKTSLTQQVSNIATEVAEQSVSVAGQVFEEKLQKEIENADKVIDGKINKVRDEINDGIEQSRAEAERYADAIKQEIASDINDLDTAMQAQAQEHDRQVAAILARTGSNADLANAAKQLAERAQADLATTRINLTGLIAQTNTKAGQLEQSITSVRADVASQARSILAQAQAQTALTNRVTTVETLADGTRSTVTELSKTVSKATGDIASVSSRTKTVEDGLVGVNTRYTETTIKIHAQTGQITTLNAKTAQLESGLNGVKEKFENIKIGSRNYFSQYLANYDTSGVYAIRLVSETQPITITVTDKDTSVDVSGCYFGLFKDKFAKQGAQWFISNSTLYNAKKTISGWPLLAVYPKNQATLDKIFSRYKVMVEIGNIATDWVPAPEDLATVTALHTVTDTVDSHTRTISTINGTVSTLVQTAKGLVTEVSGTNGLKTQVSTLAGSYAVKNLNSSGDILSQANLSSDLFLLEAAKIRLKGKTLADEIQAIDGKFETLFVADGTFAKLNATVIGSQAITADKLKVDQAFFDKLIANDAYLKQLFAKSVFTTQVQAVTLSASKISGGILTATNKAMEVNLNAGQILYYTDQAALKRVLNGYPTQFVKFATGTVTGKGKAGVTVIGSNRWNSESSNDGGFVGIRAWNGANIDQIDVVGDTVRLASSAFETADGWNINTLPGKLDIDAFNAEHR
ncbi:phage tail spike protein, partial [Streptococcus suis]|uniref:phage tail spike protein n=2 Tax=Streptococcus suis TaxID=1307 RepID=UPI000492C321